ncbi:DoxX family protein [Actinomycetota bacterium Odt1-20B]
MSETVSTAPPAPSVASGPRARRVLLTVQVLLAAFYGIASAVPKLIAHESAVEAFDKLGWGAPGMYAIGALELAGAVALLVRPLNSLAATAFIGLMCGAFVVQVTAMGGENAATPLILIVPLAWIAWARRDQNGALARLVTARR